VAAPLCQRCGLGLKAEGADEDSVCGACRARPPRFERARAALAYDDASAPAILAFKHGDRLEATPLFTRWLEAAGGELIQDADIVAPVPLHWRRMLRRRYNQAAELARALARRSGAVYAPDPVLRVKPTASQTGFSATGRRRNVAGAFALNPKWRDRVDGARVLLIDDVFTTGATVERIAAVLADAGAKTDVLTVARVERPRPV